MATQRDGPEDATRRLDAAADAPAVEPPREFGDYLLIEPLGRGGMGVVWRARQRSLDRDVAIKFVAGHGEAGSRFRDEARHAARIQHPNIVEIYEFGRRDGQDFFSMRLIDGRSLAERLRADGPLPPREAARLLRTVAEAIDYAHRLGVLHLDLKPANILLTAAGEPLVADFGLARAVGAGERGEVAGSPGYMAPEQRAHGVLDERTDVYGLGAVLARALGGRRPAGDAAGAASAGDEFEPLSTRRRQVPADLEAICRRCLAAAPTERYPDARAFADDLQRFLDGHVVRARPLGPLARGWRWARRQPALAAAIAVAFVALAGGLAASLVQAGRAEAARAAAEQQRALAEQRAARNDQLVALMAQVYPTGTPGRYPDNAAPAPEKLIVDWLQRELPGRDADQAEILTAFIAALDAADKPGAAQNLMLPVALEIGDAFRRDAAQVLIARDEPRAWALAAMLLQSQSFSPADVQERQIELLRGAVARAPDDLDVLLVAAHYCTVAACADFDPQRRLMEREPDNALNWLMAATHVGEDAAVVRELLRGAGRAPRYDDHYGRLVELSQEAVTASGVPMPQALLRSAEALSGGQDPQRLVGYLQTFTLPIPAFSPFVKACNPKFADLDEPGRRDDCLHFARLAAHDGKGLVSRMIGVAIVRRLRPGTAEANEMRELRRQYLYAFDMREAFTPEQQRRARDELQPADHIAYGELEAIKRTLDRAGIPRDPPPGWEPADPTRLMSIEEREAWQAAHPAPPER